MVLQVQQAVQPVEEAIKIAYNALGGKGQHLGQGRLPAPRDQLQQRFGLLGRQ